MKVRDMVRILKEANQDENIYFETLGPDGGTETKFYFDHWDEKDGGVYFVLDKGEAE